jgi:5-methylcytosine-specific restriction endonuclease McrA
LNDKSAGNWRTLQKRCEEIGIDVSHFTGKAKHSGGRKLTPLAEILVKDRYTCSSSLRKRLLNEGIKDHVCEMCGLKEWNGIPIALELDHVNGDRDNNELNNLRMLCPNCHAQTPTWRGRNRKPNANQVVSEVNVINAYKSVSDRINASPTFTDIMTSMGSGRGVKYLDDKKEIQSICDMNNLEIRTTSIPRKDKIQWPDNVELSGMVASMSLEAVGRKLGVTGNAVKKRCIKYGIAIKSPVHK